jgi:predicted metal-dependent hydrolase
MGESFDIVRHPTARRVRLALDPTTGRARLVVPRRAGLKAAIAWAEERAGWLAAQRAQLPSPRPFVDGAVLPVADELLTIRHDPTRRSRVVRREGDALVTGGPVETLPDRIERWLRRAALDLLTAETRHLAGVAGVAITRVSVGDPRGRWGSCASGGAIRYSWRLLLAPRHVRRSTVAHEVAHRVHMNHGATFHALAAKLNDGDPAPAHAWLRAHGASLHWYGRSSS